MKFLVTIYFEGSDSKIAVFEYDKNYIKLTKAASYQITREEFQIQIDESVKIDGDISFQGHGGAEEEFISATHQTTFDDVYVRSLNSVLIGIDFKKTEFIPVLTEPNITFQFNEETQEAGKKKKKNSQYLKNTFLFAKQNLCTVLPSGDIGYVTLLEKLARYNLEKDFRMPAVKSADLSLFYYVNEHFNFSETDHVLIFYMGKEYSRMLFCQNNFLIHISPMLNIGKINSGTYDVFASKILLEMENGEIPKIDDIILCGEDTSEEFVFTLRSFFSECRISGLDFPVIDLTAIHDPDLIDNLSAYSIPISVAYEHHKEVFGNYTAGINLLSKEILERQKAFPIGWHGYLVILLIFMAGYYLSDIFFDNARKLNKLNAELSEAKSLERKNKDLLAQISDYQGRIRGFDETQTMLDTLAAGAGQWNSLFRRTSEFVTGKKNMWLTALKTSEDKTAFQIEGYSVNKDVLTAFAESFKSAELKLVTTDKIQNKNVYKFTLIVQAF